MSYVVKVKVGSGPDIFAYYAGYRTYPIDGEPAGPVLIAEQRLAYQFEVVEKGQNVINGDKRLQGAKVESAL